MNLHRCFKGEKIANCVLKHLKNSELLDDDYNIVSETLNQCISVSESWIYTCKQLTQVFWPNYSLHTWSDSAHIPENLEELISRLNEVKIRNSCTFGIIHKIFFRFSILELYTNR